MIAGKSILAFVMAGGEGNRLYPLTMHRSKPSVPFGGRHRIVDFVLSNLINSEINAIYLLVQYKSQSLIEHIRKSWMLAPFIPQHFVTVVPPQMHHGPEWFQGTADSVFQNMHLIDIFKPDLVAVFGADHIYRMDVRHAVEFHVNAAADVCVAALPVPVMEATSFGIIHADDNGVIRRFEEKPLHAPTMPGRPGYALASMGNYIFRTEVLMEALRQAHASGESDFGRDVLPRLTRSHKVVAYDFNSNRIPGLRSYEDPCYWRDVGTIEAYFDAHFDIMGEQPKFKMTNLQWPIFASPSLSESAQVIGGRISQSVLGTGSMVRGAMINGSVLRREVIVEEDAELYNCIVMEKSIIGRGAKIRRAIIDQYNIIAPGERIGYDPEADRKRFHVSESGIVVIGRGQLKG